METLKRLLSATPPRTATKRRHDRSGIEAVNVKLPPRSRIKPPVATLQDGAAAPAGRGRGLRGRGRGRSTKVSASEPRVDDVQRRKAEKAAVNLKVAQTKVAEAKAAELVKASELKTTQIKAQAELDALKRDYE